MSAPPRIDTHLYDAQNSRHGEVGDSSAGDLSSHLAKRTRLLATCSWTNVFLPLIGIAPALSHHGITGDATSFWLNYLALSSAVGLFRYANEELRNVSPAWVRKAGWMTMGILSLDVEVAIIALCHGYLDLVKSYVVGKVVTTTLFTLGVSFSVAATRNGESTFNQMAASTLASLLATAIVPFGIITFFPSGFGGDPQSPPVLFFSRGASIVLLLIYLMYQRFRMQHAALYGDEEPTATESRLPQDHRVIRMLIALTIMPATAVATFFSATSILSSLEHHLVPSRTFIGFCLLPLLAALAHITRIYRLARAEQMEGALEAAAGMSVQVAFYVAPVFCLLGWCLGKPMSLSLDILELVAFSVSVWIFNYLIQDGKSNYMEGAMSIGLYLIQVLTFFLYGRS